MNSILFLLSDAQSAHNDNHERLPEGFRAAGWQTATAPHASLVLANGQLLCSAGRVLDFERIWALGFGEQNTFFDRMQLLSSVPAERFVTSVQALLLLHGKFHWQARMPETYVSNDPGYLLAQTGRSIDWIVKPTAGSYGRQVYRLQPAADEEGARRLLEQLTNGGRYAMLQRYLPEVEAGEKRVMFVGGLLLGAYLRVPLNPAGDGSVPHAPLANIAAGSTATTTRLEPEEEKMAQAIGNQLLAAGVGFAAIDLVYPYLMEVNIANPGGLATLATLTGADSTAEAVSALVDFWV